MSLHDGHNIHPGIIDMPQNLRHLSLGAPAVRTIIGNLHHYLMSCDGSFRTLLRHKNILRKPCVIGSHKAKMLPGALKGPHHPAYPPGNDSDDLSLLSFSGPPRNRRCLDDIAMKGSACLVLGNKEVLLSSLHLHKSKSPGIAHKGSCQHTAVRLSVFLPGRQGKPALLQKLPEQGPKFFPVLLCHLEKYCQLLFLHGNISRVAHQVADHPFSLFSDIHSHSLYKKHPCASHKSVP